MGGLFGEIDVTWVIKPMIRICIVILLSNVTSDVTRENKRTYHLDNGLYEIQESIFNSITG